MNNNAKQQRLECYIKLAQEWRLSGMTQVDFAKSKGMTVRTFEYRLKKVREEAPESLNVSTLKGIEFAPVPTECLNAQNIIGQSTSAVDQPVMMIQTAVANLQVTNQIAPHILKTALEVIMSC